MGCGENDSHDKVNEVDGVCCNESAMVYYRIDRIIICVDALYESNDKSDGCCRSFHVVSLNESDILLITKISRRVPELLKKCVVIVLISFIEHIRSLGSLTANSTEKPSLTN